MKQVIMMVCVLLGLTAWGQESGGFRIIGNLGGTLSGNLVLVGTTPEGPVKLGETVMTNGSFEFRGKVDCLTLAHIMTEQEQQIATLMLENRIFMLQASETGIEIYGGEQQQIWNQFDAVIQDIWRRQMQLQQQGKDALKAQNQMQLEALQKEFDKNAAEAKKKQRELLRMYKDAPAAVYFIALTMGQLDYKDLSELYGILGESVKGSLFGQVIEQRLTELRNLKVGGIAPDFKAVTLNGDTVSLHSVQAKVKLLDFWASWCGVCRLENPNMREMYAKYHAAGLEIIGVSLDQKKQDWAKAIRDDKLTWIQVSDLKGWKSYIGRLYNVKAIRYTYLLDANNRVIAKDLRGRELQEKIAEILGKK